MFLVSLNFFGAILLFANEFAKENSPKILDFRRSDYIVNLYATSHRRM